MTESATQPAMPTVCVSLHDVAPATWPRCETLLAAIRAVTDLPLTLLVVPDYHHVPVAAEAGFRRLLDARLAHGDELALHGYSHLDEGPPARGLRQRWQRHVMTLGEGEFSALDCAAADDRLAKGLDWFAARGWQPEGFVAPAWMLSEGTWMALRKYDFSYTTSLRYFYLLPQRQALLAPSFVYSTRHALGRWLSCRRNDVLVRKVARLPLLRLGLHPNDALHPALLRHFQHLLAGILDTHSPSTKAGFARRW